MLCKRLCPCGERGIETYQGRSGFKEGTSTIDQIFTLRQILEKTREHGIDTYHLFIDFKVAYDSVIRSKLYDAMWELQISPKIIRLIKAKMARIACKMRIQMNCPRPLQ